MAGMIVICGIVGLLFGGLFGMIIGAVLGVPLYYGILGSTFVAAYLFSGYKYRHVITHERRKHKIRNGKDYP